MKYKGEKSFVEIGDNNEIREFVNCIRHNGFVLGDLNDALKAILVVEKVYKIQLKNNGGYENGNIC